MIVLKSVLNIAASLSLCVLLAEASCKPSVSFEADLTEACADSIAKDALDKQVPVNIASSVATRLGLAPSGAAGYTLKKVEFKTDDGASHYFAVDGPNWSRAVLIRISQDGVSTLFVMGKNGKLQAAGRVRDEVISLLDVQQGAVRSEFAAERGLWAAAGPDGVCGQP